MQATTGGRQINRVRKVLADGTVKYYEYTRRGALPAPKEERSTLAGLIARYEASPKFTKLADNSKVEYLRRFKIIAAEWGEVPVERLEDDAFLDRVLEWRDKIAQRSPRQADSLLSNVSLVLSWAVKRRIIKANVLAGQERVYEVDRSKMVWTEEHIRRFVEVAPRELSLALLLAITTAQRQGDLLKLKWAQYDGKRIRITQEKTGVDVVVPCTKLLRETLDNLERRGEYILTTSGGRPWTRTNFKWFWFRAAKAAGIGLHFHDLRGTAITHLADAGCSIPEICAISGHSLSSAQILTKYVNRTSVQAGNAIEKLEAHTTIMPALEGTNGK